MVATDVITFPERPHDPDLLNLDVQETHFFKSLTGIQDDEELKQHIIKVQKKAYQVCQEPGKPYSSNKTFKTYPYPCIAIFAFTSLRSSRLPGYNQALELSRTRSDPIFLDLGCCFGNILRKAVVDGWPVEGAIGSDLHRGLWEYGHELFKSSPEMFPAGFVAGDALSSALIEPKEPFYSPPQTPRPADLRALASLTPLQGHVSAINASLFFHLFNEEQQLFLAKQVATLLSTESGSVIFGVHSGQAEKGANTEVMVTQGGHMFSHSPGSWKNLWECQVFKPGSVKVEAELAHRPRPLSYGAGLISNWLVWSVTRL
ncbi:hypothetical protein D9756_003136 [Leucocoprinus leucothites]|uniref:Methyltransferase ausD n=1 Tax=Leucocoprinus leucothites TaxID=201217 RepID=A0A8H5G6D8_9AGAR|nr:hypothetical protein D9756_003136 [Leucoagaricus leucothites]